MRGVTNSISVYKVKYRNKEPPKEPHVISMCCEGKERRVFDKRCKVHSLRITIAKVQCSSISSQAGSLTHALALKGSIYIFLLGERIPPWSTETRLVGECTEEKMRNLILM